MGAAWVLKQKYDTILLPEFDFPQIKGAINPQQIGIKLDSDCTELNQRLNELKDSLIDEFELQSLSTAKWERHRNEFVIIFNYIQVEFNNEINKKLLAGQALFLEIMNLQLLAMQHMTVSENRLNP